MLVLIMPEKTPPKFLCFNESRCSHLISEYSQFWQYWLTLSTLMYLESFKKYES